MEKVIFVYFYGTVYDNELAGVIQYKKLNAILTHATIWKMFVGNSEITHFQYP